MKLKTSLLVIIASAMPMTALAESRYMHDRTMTCYELDSNRASRLGLHLEQAGPVGHSRAVVFEDAYSGQKTLRTVTRLNSSIFENLERYDNQKGDFVLLLDLRTESQSGVYASLGIELKGKSLNVEMHCVRTFNPAF